MILSKAKAGRFYEASSPRDTYKQCVQALFTIENKDYGG